MPVKEIHATPKEVKSLFAVSKLSLMKRMKDNTKKWRDMSYEEIKANKFNLPDSVLLPTMHHYLLKG